jgi:predicted RNase H-like HicB family nuclease
MAATAQVRIALSVLIYREDQWWIAHCLEMDLPAEGSSPQEALDNLLDIARVQVESAIDEGNLESIFSPAPPELWSQFAESRDFTQRPSRAPINSVDTLVVREAVALGV